MPEDAAPRRFTGNFTQQEPIPDEGIAAALAVMRSGRLHRYNLAEGEAGETALLEAEFAALTGARHCLAVASGGYAIGAALRALGAELALPPGAPVLTNAFTLAPVPGAIAAAGFAPRLVEITEDLVIDLSDLEAQIGATGARLLVLSHMRGHICNMGALIRLCDGRGVQVIEDCAHTMGAAWDGVPSGRHGAMACYSTQTYKHVNSGEGGLLTTDDGALAARAVVLSGSYALQHRHLAAPGPEAFAALGGGVPNVSGRMDNLRAAILRPQLRGLARNVVRWNQRHDLLASRLGRMPGVVLPRRPAAESYVGSSIQFRLPEVPAERIAALVARAADRGVMLKWFGAARPEGYTSRHDHWTYLAPRALPKTDLVLASLLDMRLPLTFSLADCEDIAAILAEEIAAATAVPAPAEPPDRTAARAAPA